MDFICSVFCRWADVSVMEATMAARRGRETEETLTSEIISPEHHPAAEYLVQSLPSLISTSLKSHVRQLSEVPLRSK